MDQDSPSGAGGSGQGGKSAGAGGTAGSGGALSSGGSGGSSGGTTGNAGSSSGGAGGSSAGSSSGGSGATGACMADGFLKSVGKEKILSGAGYGHGAMPANFDLRYLYISGGLSGNEPCTSCQGCTGEWWGCWQDTSQAPGLYITNYINDAKGGGQVPMFTYYMLLHAADSGEQGLTAAANNQTLMHGYLADWRFLLQKIGNETAILHIEPDFWGFAQSSGGNDATAIPAAVASANATDCGSQSNSIAGLGKCMISMVRKYAPNARVGLHASAWGTNKDVSLNGDGSFNVVAEAQKLGTFLIQAGASESDIVIVEASDRDAGWYQSQGQNRWWNAENTSLPNFTQMFTWTKTLAEQVGKPVLWWQLPIGNMSLPNTYQQWQDNRVTYFYAHPDQIAAAHGVGFAFGGGNGEQTSIVTDNNNLINLANAYRSSGGQNPCP